jgi:hypothetical protein
MLLIFPQRLVHHRHEPETPPPPKAQRHAIKFCQAFCAVKPSASKKPTTSNNPAKAASMFAHSVIARSCWNCYQQRRSARFTDVLARGLGLFASR